MGKNQQKSVAFQELEIFEKFLAETPEHGIRESANYIFEHAEFNVGQIKNTTEEHLVSRFMAVLDIVNNILNNPCAAMGGDGNPLSQITGSETVRSKNIILNYLKKIKAHDFMPRFLRSGNYRIRRNTRYNNTVLNYLKNDNTRIYEPLEKEEIIECLNEKPLSVFPYRFVKETITPEVFYDDNSEMFFVLHKNKRLYFPQNWTQDNVKEYYRGLLIEQHPLSPHCYASKGFGVGDNDIIADIGAAEGIWALENIETAKFAYIFERDENYIRALHKTFEPYKTKVQIVNKYVGKFTKGVNISIDDFVSESGKPISFIKADIEGAEVSMLDGMLNLLKSKQDLRLVLCTYHRRNDAAILEERLKRYGFYTKFSHGYMLPVYQKLWFQEPYFRKGLINAKR